VRVRELFERAVEEGFTTIVPPVVIAETTRGGARDARVNQILKAIDRVSTIDEETGRLAGRLLGRASSNEVIDALVVATAIERGGGRIVTSDPDDLGPLAEGNPEVSVHGI
jgi:predicted nucleic acid-binding protein